MSTPTPTPEAVEAEYRAAAGRGETQAVLKYLRALVEQAEYAVALPLAMRACDALTDPRDLLHATHDLVTCCSQLGLADVARPYVAKFQAAIAASAYPADHLWPALWLYTLDRPADAAEAFQRGIARFPDDTFLRTELGRLQVATGHPEGLAAMRLFCTPAFWSVYHNADTHGPWETMWQGESLAGKSLVVIGHGGVGDTIQFVRYARLLAEQGAREVVVYAPTPHVEGLLRSAEGVRVAARTEVLYWNVFDYWTSTFGLCLHLIEAHGTQNRGPYLQPPASPLGDGVLQAARTKSQGRKCVGLWWHSDAHNGLVKSVPLAALLPLFGLENIHWVIFQRGLGLRQLQRSGLDAQCTLVPEAATFDDQAGIMKGLDGMVAIDSFASHMAGAIGCRNWMLAGRALDWRYFDSSDVSPWYADSRICRQPALGDWRSAVRNLAEELARL